MVKCSVCKTGKTDAWYKNNKLALNDLCNFCCDSSGSDQPKDWVGLCAHCVASEAAYPIYSSGFKQFVCCECYLVNRDRIKKMRFANKKEKDQTKPFMKTQKRTEADNAQKHKT